MGEQPILSVKAHVYHIDRQTRKSWVMVSKQALPVSFFFDKQRNVYRIISVEGTRAVINSIVANSTVVRKTSHKFVQWADQRSDIVYGLGFAAESDVILFVEKFAEIKRKVSVAVAPGNSDQASQNPTPTLADSNYAEYSTLPNRSDSNHPADLPLSNYHESRRPTRCSSAQPHNFSHSQTHHSNMRSNSNDHLPAFCESFEEPGNRLGFAGSDVEQIRLENARLVAALRKSAENVKKWEQELNRLREENRRLSKEHHGENESSQRKHDQFNSLPSSLKNRRISGGCCSSRSNDSAVGSRPPDAAIPKTSSHSTHPRAFYEKLDSIPSNNLPGESLREQLRLIENVYDQVLLQNRHLHSILQDGRQRLVRVIAEVDDLTMADRNNTTDTNRICHYSLSSTPHSHATAFVDTSGAAPATTTNVSSNISETLPVQKHPNDSFNDASQNAAAATMTNSTQGRRKLDNNYDV